MCLFLHPFISLSVTHVKMEKDWTPSSQSVEEMSHFSGPSPKAKTLPMMLLLKDLGLITEKVLLSSQFQNKHFHITNIEFTVKGRQSTT